VTAGEIHAFAGENGAGKSTLIEINLWCHPARTGRYYLDGSHLILQVRRMRRELVIGMVFHAFPR